MTLARNAADVDQLGDAWAIRRERPANVARLIGGGPAPEELQFMTLTADLTNWQK